MEVILDTDSEDTIFKCDQSNSNMSDSEVTYHQRIYKQCQPMNKSQRCPEQLERL
jgi:hypothetical protein